MGLREGALERGPEVSVAKMWGHRVGSRERTGIAVGRECSGPSPARRGKYLVISKVCGHNVALFQKAWPRTYWGQRLLVKVD